MVYCNRGELFTNKETNTMKQKRFRTPKYPDALKKQAGELSGKGYSVRQIAETLGVSYSTADYLGWRGKIMLGIPYPHRRPWKKDKHFDIMDFEHEVYPVPQRAKWTMYLILFCVLLALFSPLINKVVGMWIGLE